MKALGDRARIAALCDRALDALTTPHRRIGASIMRVLLGSAIALFFIQNIGLRRFFWGPDGLVPISFAPKLIEQHGPSLYLLSPSLPYFEVVFWLGLIAAFAFACGRWIPFSTVACAVLTWCLFARDGFIPDSGWTFATLLLIYAIALDCGSFLVAGKWWAAPGASVPASSFIRRVGALLHNLAAALVLWQVSLIYAIACFYKMTGHKWQDGTALYYILRSNQFDLSALNAHIYHSALLVTAGTYATIVLQAAFPFCIWQRPAKYFVAIGAIGFHVSIACTMALPFFSLVMLASEALVFSDRDYRTAAGALRALGARFAAASRSGTLVGKPSAAVAAIQPQTE